MQFNTSQRVVAGLGGVALALSLLWVPYTAHLKDRGSYFDRDIGYALIFRPPQEAGCRSAFGGKFPERRLEVGCSVKIEASRVVMTSTAIAIATIGLLLLTGIF